MFVLLKKESPVTKKKSSHIEIKSFLWLLHSYSKVSFWIFFLIVLSGKSDIAPPSNKCLALKYIIFSGLPSTFPCLILYFFFLWSWRLKSGGRSNFRTKRSSSAFDLLWRGRGKGWGAGVEVNGCHGRHMVGLCNKICVGIAVLHGRQLQIWCYACFAICVGVEAFYL